MQAPFLWKFYHYITFGTGSRGNHVTVVPSQSPFYKLHRRPYKLYPPLNAWLWTLSHPLNRASGLRKHPAGVQFLYPLFPHIRQHFVGIASSRVVHQVVVLCNEKYDNTWAWHICMEGHRGEVLQQAKRHLSLLSIAALKKTLTTFIIFFLLVKSKYWMKRWKTQTSTNLGMKFCKHRTVLSYLTKRQCFLTSRKPRRVTWCPRENIKQPVITPNPAIQILFTAVLFWYSLTITSQNWLSAYSPLQPPGVTNEWCC